MSNPFKKSKLSPISIPNPNPNPNPKASPKNVFDSPPFIHRDFTNRRHWNLQTTTVYSVSSDATSWLYAADYKLQPLNPLTLKPHPNNLDLLKHQSTSLTSFDHTYDFAFDKLVIPPPRLKTIDRVTILGLHSGGHLVARLPLIATHNVVKWVALSDDRFDDAVNFQGSTFLVDRFGRMYSILDYRQGRILKLCPYLITLPVTLGFFQAAQVGYRKRLVAGLGAFYLVVRQEANVFRVCKLVEEGMSGYWDEIKGFGGRKVLFVSKDCCFFIDGFGGREYEDCVVFLESGFPKYGSDGWEYDGEDAIGVFRLSDGRYGKVGESVDFPEIDWSPPSWIFDVGEPDKDGRRVQCHSNNSNSKNEDEQEGMKEQEGMEEQEERSDSDIRVLEDEEMQSDANVGGDTSLLEDVPPSLFSSISAVEEEVTRTLLCMNGETEPTDKECSRKIKNTTLLAPRACTSSSTAKGYKGDSATTKFEGFDIRSDLVPILLKIWGKHGNIIENSTIHSRDLIARALELLATMVQILENNSVESLSDCQADYLSSTLSDLKIMSFNVDWLSSFVEKAVKLHKRKALVDSLNKLGQLSSQVKESRAMLLDKVAKLAEEENKLKKEMAKVSEAILFSKLVKFDEPLGLGLT